MRFVTKKEANVEHLQARTVYRMIEEKGVFKSDNMTLGIARFDQTLGAMTPHSHKEEGMYIIDCARAYARFGASEAELGERIPLEAGMIMQAADGEVHVFEFDDGGYMDIVFFFATGSFSRPK